MATSYEYLGSQGGNWQGADSTFTGLENEDNFLYGDVTQDLSDRAKGGDDTLTAGTSSFYHNQLYGDAYNMYDRAQGGDDTLTAAIYNWESFLIGDAVHMYDHAQGGDDTLTSGAFSLLNDLYGDSVVMHDHAQGGDDTLTSGVGNFQSFLYGDANSMYDYAKGGDDTLISGADSQYNYMYGDAFEMAGAARGGDDILISGTGDDDMWGDAYFMDAGALGGSDTFVFAGGNGNDIVYDFEQGKDLIDLSAFGATIFAALDSNNNGSLDDGDDYVSYDGQDTVIDLGAASGGTAGEDTVTVAGVTGLTDADFLV